MTGLASPAPESSLDELARYYGIEADYTDGCGVDRHASRWAVFRVLQALGAPLETPADAEQAAETARRDRWASVLAPVSVAWDGRLAADLRVAETDMDQQVRCALSLEDGDVREWAERVDGLTTADVAEVDGRRHCLKRLPISSSLPLGYHRLVVNLGGRSAESLVISAPTQAFSRRGAGVGLFLPLYALHSARSWGVGDFSDLDRLLEWLPSTGGRAFSMLPILATEYDADPCDPSPYLPVSRLFWNELFVDPRRLPEFSACVPAQRLVESDRFRRGIASLQTAPLIDYPGALAAKREVLELLVGTLESHPGGRSQEFQEWVRRHELADAYATFRAGRERRAPRETAPPAVAGAARRLAGSEGDARRYHLYAQWAAEQQVEQLAARARAVGDGLYLDFPLGVHPEGFDVARHPGLFTQGVSIGAPPDELFPSGQHWNTPPPDPRAARCDGYRYLRAALGRHLEVAGSLRIDHVMGIHRLYWIPDGGDASDGVYVHYPADEAYAVLCLESWRHRTVVVGENLGTVPPYVNEALAAHALGGLHVAQFLVRTDEASPLAPVPAGAGAVASLNTHDTATFAGFLDGADIEDRLARGLLDPAGAAQVHERRRRQRAVLATLPDPGPAAAVDAADQESAETRMLRGCLGGLARSGADMLLVNLEDLWLEKRPQNVPGTGPERLNWRRRARHALEVFTDLPEVNETLRTLALARLSRTASSSASSPSSSSASAAASSSAAPPGEPSS